MTDVSLRQFHLEPVSAVVSHLTGVLHDLAAVGQKGCNETNFYRDAETASGWLAAKPQRSGAAGGRRLRDVAPRAPAGARATGWLTTGGPVVNPLIGGMS